MRNGLRKFIRWGEAIVRNAERGDDEALHWCGFVNLTAISVVVAVIVLAAWWWI